ncbi:hypothetical protein GCM10027614_27190 [Micromonospora vulcania]
MEIRRYAGPARQALHRAARRAYALHGLDAAASHAGRALSLADDSDPVGRLQLELLSTEISFYRDGNGFLSGGGPEQVHALADRLLVHGDDACAARAWTLLGQAAWLRADRSDALACLDRAVQLFEPLADTPQKADAYAELGRLHMLNYERDPAVAAADTAAEIAERLGLTETRTNARITAPPPATSPATGSAWTSCTRSSSSAGPVSCSPCPGRPRTSRTRSGRRATGCAPTPCSRPRRPAPPAARR